jgi:hypothetical protein
MGRADCQQETIGADYEALASPSGDDEGKLSRSVSVADVPSSAFRPRPLRRLSTPLPTVFVTVALLPVFAVCRGCSAPSIAFPDRHLFPR